MTRFKMTLSPPDPIRISGSPMGVAVMIGSLILKTVKYKTTETMTMMSMTNSITPQKILQHLDMPMECYLKASKLKQNRSRDSFVGDVKAHSSRERDVEMGTQFLGSKSDVGMEAFSKQVEKLLDKLSDFLKKLKNLVNQQKPGCGRVSGIDRLRTTITKYIEPDNS
ncbi:hypothetical protein RJ641_015284 [Dillenia turbinata]|uniref:Uncharacterized protein n=1 Tax=Dillenia turbinata TaxID=194707 RepID=A0AAN8Z0X9_9MAGN